LTLTEKVWIRLSDQAGIESYADIDPQHAAIGCAGCHQGTSPADAEDDTSAFRMAHTNMTVDPSADADYGCNGSQCHSDIVRQNETSMHSQLWGEKAHIAARLGVGSFEECPTGVQEGWTKDCSGCHTTCGQCHVSRPHSAGKGFLVQRVGYSHQFIRTPDEENVCTACHGSRIGDDWNGNEERLPGNHPDVHNEAGMTCLDCHHEDLHGDGESDAQYTSRYEVQGLPQCVDCHGASTTSNAYHTKHWPNGNFDDGADLACFVCHSQQYNNCNTCHAGNWTHEYEEDNSGEYRVYAQFKIGKNPKYGLSGYVHADAEYIAVRHIPISPDAYRNDPWGVADMLVENAEAFNSMPTWKYTSPHNIQRWTARTLVDSAWLEPAQADYDNTTCRTACHIHGTAAASTMNIANFLYEDDITNDATGDDLSDELVANQYVTFDGQIISCRDACHYHD